MTSARISGRGHLKLNHAGRLAMAFLVLCPALVLHGVSWLGDDREYADMLRTMAVMGAAAAASLGLLLGLTIKERLSGKDYRQVLGEVVIIVFLVVVYAGPIVMLTETNAF